MEALQLFHHAYKLSYRSDPQLLHNMAAMGFNGLFRHSELSANLFIEQPP
jgi:hypothetical protein